MTLYRTVSYPPCTFSRSFSRCWARTSLRNVNVWLLHILCPPSFNLANYSDAVLVQTADSCTSVWGNVAVVAEPKEKDESQSPVERYDRRHCCDGDRIERR